MDQLCRGKHFHKAPPQIKLLQQVFCYPTMIHHWEELEKAYIFMKIEVSWHAKANRNISRLNEEGENSHVLIS